MPRIFEKIHTAATAKADAAGGAKAKIFHWAVGVGRAGAPREDYGGRPPLALKVQYALADKLVLHKIRDLFGGRMKLALSGAAPIDTEILEFFHAAGVWVLEGYGMTETCAVETLNTIEEHRFGTVGRPLPGVCEVKIADDGEVLMRGPNIFKGYYNNERGHARDARRRRLAALRRPRRARRGRLPLDHRPQEGPHHHLERQEHLARRTSRTRSSCAAGSRRRSSSATGGRTSPRC